MRVQISIDDVLLSEIDKYAKTHFLSRSGFISMAATQYLSQVEVVQAIKDLDALIKNAVDKGSLDDEALKALQDFEMLSKMLINAK